MITSGHRDTAEPTIILTRLTFHSRLLSTPCRMSAPIGFTGVNLGYTEGATLAGIFFSLVLYGVSLLQTFIYYVRYPNDKAYLKLLVAVVFLLDTLHKFLVCAAIWNYMIEYYGNFANLYVSHAPLTISVAVTTTASFVAQSYFVWRIWFLSTNRYFKFIFSAVMMPVVIAQPVLGIYCTTVTMISPTVMVISSRIQTVATAYTGSAAAVDIVIALAMCTLLATGRTGCNKHTDRMLLRLIVVSVNTGLWTAVFGLLTVVLLVTLPKDLVYLGVFLPLCTLYCNTVLANLNVREYVRGGNGPEVYHLNDAGSSERYRTGGTAAVVNYTLPVCRYPSL
ncbi:hypothetical protein HYDPIDRAFT_111276 [Hydnomerulius pinastri MD-312]|uniref:DUF6534 domain-containing protein n=1 Tax=Hydnomerulius pinastri MD-312 TaxID=994086 RepID=A0A0C9WFD5_9AGAM|nr:hypothetical protein HYDPIDRAFT_111276 [Hydnomerulius pinastri MD-312]